jgi:hypothetical protein
MTTCAQYFNGMFNARIMFHLSDRCGEIPDSMVYFFTLHHKAGQWLHHVLVLILAYQNMCMM